MRVFLLAFCVLAAMVGVRGQAPADKITSQEYIEANELSREFFQTLIKTGDIGTVVSKFGTPDFKDCISENELALFPEVTAKDFSRDQIVRMYFAETDFLALSMVFGSQQEYDDDDLTPDSFPMSFKKRLGQKSLEFILGSDDSKRPADFMPIVRSLERANPAFRREMIRTNASATEKFRSRLDWLETESTVAEYMFRPELSMKPQGCGLKPETTRVINVDVPMYQLQLVRVGGKLKVFKYVVHVH